MEARDTQIEAPAEEIQVQISNNVASQIDDAIVEKTQLQIPSPVTPVSLIPLPSTPDSRKRKAVDEQVSPWKSRKLISSPQIQVTSNLNHKSKPIAANPNATTQNHHWGQKLPLAEIWKRHLSVKSSAMLVMAMSEEVFQNGKIRSPCFIAWGLDEDVIHGVG